MTIGSHPVRALAAIAAAALAAACSTYQPTWTPESVAPPATLRDALDAIDREPSLPQGEVLLLTRDGAILSALAANRSLAVERFNPLIAGTLAPEARAAFDPSLLATTSFGKSSFQRSATNTSAGVRRNLAGDVEVSQFLPTGTEVFLAGGMDRESRSGQESSTYIGNWSVGVNQSLLRGRGSDVNLVDLRVARNEEAITQSELVDFIMELTAAVEFAYWGLALAVETESIREFSLELAQEQLRINRDQFEVGRALRADVLTAEAEVAERRADLIDARAAVRTRTLELVRLLGPTEPAQWAVEFDLADLPEVDRIDVNPLVSAQLAALYRPELAQARLQLENRDLALIRTRNGLLPRLDTFASYGRRTAGANLGDTIDRLGETDAEEYRVGLSFEMQPLNRAERARNARARFQRAQAEAAVLNLEELIELEVRLIAVEVDREWQRILATEEVVRGREEQLRAAREQVLAGLITTLDSLQIQRDYVQSQVDLATARIRYIQSLTELYRREGTLLDRRGIGAAPRAGE